MPSAYCLMPDVEAADLELRNAAAVRRRRGFSLIEVAMATAIVGVAVAALMTTIASGTKANRGGQELTQAGFLAQEMREYTLGIPYNSLASATHTPPIDGRGVVISGMTDWSQQVTVTYRSPSNLATVVTPGPTDIAYIQVVISYKNSPVLTTGWLVARSS